MIKIEESPMNHYYTHPELRGIAKERGIKLKTNTPRSDLCELLGLPIGDRGGICFKGALKRVCVLLVNVVSGEHITIPSINRTMKVLDIRCPRTIKNRIYCGRVFRIDEEIKYYYGDTYFCVPEGDYRLKYVDRD